MRITVSAVTLVLPSIAMIVRMTRSSALEVVREDYLRSPDRAWERRRHICKK